MKNPLLLVFFWSSSFTPVISQWTLEYELPADSYLIEMAVHEPSGKYLFGVYFEAPEMLALYEYDDGEIKDITPINHIWEDINFRNPTSEGHLLFEMNDGNDQAYVYDGHTLSQFPLIDVSGNVISADSLGRLFYFKEESNLYTCYYYENHIWDSVTISGIWTYTEELEDENSSTIYSSNDGTVPFVFTNINGFDSLFYFENGNFFPLSLNEEADIIIAIEHFDNGDVYFYTRDTHQIEHFYVYNDHVVTSIATPILQGPPNFLHQDKYGNTYWGISDTMSARYIMKYDGSSSDITPSNNQDGYEFIMEGEDHLIFRSRDTNDFGGRLWKTKDQGITWLDVTPYPVQATFNFLTATETLLFIIEGNFYTDKVLHVLDGSAWRSQALIDSSGYNDWIDLREVLGEDSIVIQLDYAIGIDSFFVFNGNAVENINPSTSPFITDLEYLDFYRGYGFLFRTTGLNGSEKLILSSDGVSTDLTPPGLWERIEHIRDVPKGFYQGSEFNRSSHDQIFYFKDGHILLGMDASHHLSTGSVFYVDSDDRIYYEQDGDNTQVREGDGDSIYNLTLFDTSIMTIYYEAFHQGEDKMILNIDNVIYSFKVNADQYEPCSADIMIPHHQPLNVEVYSAQAMILCEAQINSESMIQFKAAESVEFRPGFKVSNGTVFESSITDECNTSP